MARRSWFGIVILVAIIDVATVSIQLSRNQRLRGASENLAGAGDVWVTHLAMVSNLRALAETVVVPAPSNVETGVDVQPDAFATFNDAVDEARRDMVASAGAEREELGAALDALSQRVAELAMRRSAVREALRARDAERLSTALADTEVGAREVHAELASIERMLTERYRRAVSSQQATSAAMQRSDLAIVGVNLLLIVAAVVVGRFTTAGDPEAESAAALLFEKPVASAGSPTQIRPRSKPIITTKAATGDSDLDEFPSEADLPSKRRAV